MKRVSFLECFYEGDVQGVGFRYNTFQVAQRYKIKGFVKNLPDGRVHVQVEGDSTEVLGFRKELEQKMGTLIHKVSCENQMRAPQFQAFDIEH